jgi:hypothetical protein
MMSTNSRTEEPGAELHDKLLYIEDEAVNVALVQAWLQTKANRAVFSLNNKSGGQLADKFRPFPAASLRFVIDPRFLAIRQPILYLSHSREIRDWWLGRESNPRHEDFQSSALPTELPSLFQGK